MASLDITNIISCSGEGLLPPAQEQMGLGLPPTTHLLLPPRSATQTHGLEPFRSSPPWGAIPPDPGLRGRAALCPTPRLVSYAWYHQQ